MCNKLKQGVYGTPNTLQTPKTLKSEEATPKTLKFKVILPMNPENPEIYPFYWNPEKNILDTKNPEIYPFLIGYDRLQSFYKQNISQIFISFQ